MNFMKKIYRILPFLLISLVAQNIVFLNYSVAMDNSSDEESEEAEEADWKDTCEKFYEIALKRERTAEEKQFLEECAQKKYEDGDTFLHKVITFISSRDMAVQKKKFIIFHLLSNGANLNDVDDDGNNAVHRVVMRNTPSKSTSSSSSTSSDKEYKKEAQVFSPFKRVGDLSAQHLNAQNNKGATPLHIAASLATFNTAIVELLLENGADPLIQDENRRTPLHRLISQKNLSEKVKLANLNVFIATCSKSVLGKLARCEDINGNRIIDLVKKLHGESSEIYKLISKLDKRLVSKTVHPLSFRQ